LQVGEGTPLDAFKRYQREGRISTDDRFTAGDLETIVRQYLALEGGAHDNIGADGQEPFDDPHYDAIQAADNLQRNLTQYFDDWLAAQHAPPDHERTNAPRVQPARQTMAAGPLPTLTRMTDREWHTNQRSMNDEQRGIFNGVQMQP
jgi:hypothetical protein